MYKYPSVTWRARGKLLNSICRDTDVPCQWLTITITPSVVVVCSGLTSLQQFFSHITTVSGCDRELNVHFYSAASDT